MCLDEVGDQMRPALAQHELAAALCSDIEQCLRRDALAGQRHDFNVTAQWLLAREMRAAGFGRDYEHRYARIIEAGMIRRDVAAGGYEHGRRLWREAQPGAYCGRFSGSRRMDRRGDPAPARVGADSAGADEHEVRDGAQQRHHEAVRLVEAADL